MSLGKSAAVLSFALALLAEVFCWNQCAAAVILIDLNTNSGAGGPGGTWNSYAIPADITGATVVDSTNTATQITFNKTGTITDNTANSGTAVFDPAQLGVMNQPAWVAAGGNDDAAADNFFTSNAANTNPDSYTLIFGGFTPGDKVTIDLLASRNSASANGFFDYSLDGGTNWAGFTVLNADGSLATTAGWDTNTTATQFFSLQSQGFTLHRYMNASDLTLSGSTLRIRTTDLTTSSGLFSAMNALQLTVTPVPEPGTYFLVIAAIAGIPCWRKFRR